MAYSIRKFLEGIRLVPKAVTSIASAGEMEVVSNSINVNATALLHFDGSGTSIVDELGNTVTVYGTASQTSGGVYLNCLETPSPGGFITVSIPSPIGTQDFTLECWLYPITGEEPYFDSIIGLRIPGSQRLDLYAGSTSTLSLYDGFSALPFNLAGTQTVNFDQWNHIAISRSSGNMRFYVNGVLSNEAPNSSSITANELIVAKSADSNPATATRAKFDEVRLIVGSSLYSGASITVPTPPLQQTSSSIGEYALNFHNGVSASSIITETSTSTLSNKTLESPVLNTPTSGTITGKATETFTIQSASDQNLSLQAQGTGVVNVESISVSNNTITGGNSTLTIQGNGVWPVSIQVPNNSLRLQDVYINQNDALNFTSIGCLNDLFLHYSKTRFYRAIGGNQLTSGQTGSDVIISKDYTNSLICVLDNSSLTSIAGIESDSSLQNQVLILTNLTGSSVTIKNLSGVAGANKISTGIGSDLLFYNQSSLILYREFFLGGWRVLNAPSNATYADTQISALNIDWSLGNTFYKEISSNSTFTFSNAANGQTISAAIKNTGATEITITLPSALASGTLNTTIAAGKENLYTFLKSNSKIYATVVTDMA